MPTFRSRLPRLSRPALHRLASFAHQQARLQDAYNDRMMERRQRAIHWAIFPITREDLARIREFIPSVIEAHSARRIWMLRRQIQALRCLRATPRPRLP